MMWDGVPAVAMLIWLLFGLLMLVLLVALIVWVVRSVGRGGDSSWSSPSGSSRSEPNSARDELDRRYARGEITREEYRQIREDLEGPAGWLLLS